MVRDKTVKFKGTKGGLKIYIDNGAPFDSVISDLKNKLDSSRHFFEGTPVNLTFLGRDFNENEQENIIRTLSEFLNVGYIEFSERDEEVPKEDFFESFDGIEEGMTRFIKGTVRNGQRIFFEGNVVIVGDVNPGGEVVAGGNIIVLGTIRGMAHAGATGNLKAIVSAYSLQPTQLRIGGIITRPPEDDLGRPNYPEISYIKDGNLVIEPYLPGKVK